jgi:hypothetical protein
MRKELAPVTPDHTVRAASGATARQMFGNGTVATLASRRPASNAPAFSGVSPYDTLRGPATGPRPETPDWSGKEQETLMKTKLALWVLRHPRARGLVIKGLKSRRVRGLALAAARRRLRR